MIPTTKIFFNSLENMTTIQPLSLWPGSVYTVHLRNKHLPFRLTGIFLLFFFSATHSASSGSIHSMLKVQTIHIHFNSSTIYSDLKRVCKRDPHTLLCIWGAYWCDCVHFDSNVIANKYCPRALVHIYNHPAPNTRNQCTLQKWIRKLISAMALPLSLQLTTWAVCTTSHDRLLRHQFLCEHLIHY